MRSQSKSNKFILSVLVVTFATVTFFPFSKAQAIVDEALELVKVPVAGVGFPNFPDPETEAQRIAKKIECEAEVAAAEAANATSANFNLLSFGASLIGGDITEAGRTKLLISLYTKAKVCVVEYFQLYDNWQYSQTILEAKDLARDHERFNALNIEIDKRLKELDERQNMQVKDFLKAMVTRIALNVTKVMATDVVRGLVDHYKISDFGRYGDVLGTQIYATDYINRNYSGDEREQLLVRSFLQAGFDNQPSQLVVAEQYAQSMAEQNLGYRVDELAENDPEFYSKLLDQFDPQTNPVALYQNGELAASQAKAAGDASAQSEIANGNGFIPIRNCGDSLIEQQAFDREHEELMKERKVILLALAEVNSGLRSAKTDEEKKFYQEQVVEGQRELAELDKRITESRKVGVGKISQRVCEGISSPAEFISKSINDYLGGYLDKTFDTKTDNMPYSIAFLSDMTSGFITNILRGLGDDEGSLFTEDGLGNLRSGVATDITVPPTSGVTSNIDFSQTPGYNDYVGDSEGPVNPPPTGPPPPDDSVDEDPSVACEPKADRRLEVECSPQPLNINDEIDILVSFPAKAGQIELSSSILVNGSLVPEIEPGDPDNGVFRISVTAQQDQPLTLPFRVTAEYTVVQVRFTPTDNSGIYSVSLPIILSSYYEQGSGNNQGNNNQEVLGLSVVRISPRGQTGLLVQSKPAGITLR